MEITGIDHPAIACEDLDIMVEWYVDTLGYKRYFHESDRNVWIIQSPDGTFIEMMQKDENERPPWTVLMPGFSHLAFRVGNLDQAIALLDQKGVSWMGDPVPAIGGGMLRSFSDPEGNMLQIVER
jgi:glyoxylase I family protein